MQVFSLLCASLILICFVASVEFGAQFVKAMLTLAHPKTEARSTFLNVLSAVL